MFSIKIFCLLFIAIVFERIECQDLLRGSPLSGIDSLPGVGACDRIASRGVANCMENFLPNNILSSFTGSSSSRSKSNGICCNYSKYKACINGLHTGLRIAMQRAKCPKSYSTQIIKSLGDSSVGLPLKSVCGANKSGRSQCPPNGATKPKRKGNRKPPKRTQVEDDVSSATNPISDVFNRGTGGLGGGNDPTSLLNPVTGLFNRGTGGGSGRRKDQGNDPTSLLDPVTGLFNRGTGGLGGGNDPTSLLSPVTGLFNRGTGGGGSGRRKDEGTAGLGGGNDPSSFLSPVTGLFNRGTGGRGDSNANPLGPIGDVFNKGRETFEQGASSVLNTAQGLFGGLGRNSK